MKEEKFRPDHVPDYFRLEWFSLTLVTVSGLIYNIGLLAGPWFEGQMAECLMNILKGNENAAAMLSLAAGYTAAIVIVQAARYIKRFYVRRFANNVNRRMKKILYASMIHKSRKELEQEGAGNVITKAISDVDDCVEGMRKFTTEVFDTGVAMTGYVVMLLVYDWRLALLSMIFPPVSYVIAEKMKKIVQRTGAAYKVKYGELSSATLDRVSNALTYRVYSCERQQSDSYEQKLTGYERAAVKADIWSSAMPPLYRVISMGSVVFILWFGGRNVLQTGWTSWDIAAFTTFLSCFTKLSVKSSKAAKLFNAVQKAQVSWKRIHPYMESCKEESVPIPEKTRSLEFDHLSFAYPGSRKLFEDVCLKALPGQVIGITGPVACGKSTLGRVLLGEYPYEGSVRCGGREISSMPENERRGLSGYLGHDPEILNDTIRANILLGDSDDAEKYLKIVCLDREVSEMKEGEDTMVGTGGIRLSGGQAQRLALARTLKHRRPVMVLDDPFSALDKTTERQIFAGMRSVTKDSIVLLISHRLYLFPELDQVIWMDNGKTVTGTHDLLMRDVPLYAQLYNAQEGGDESENEK